jgi:hypothetical protein
MTARVLGPPGNRRGGPHQKAAHNVDTTTDPAIVAHTPDTTGLPRCGLCDRDAAAWRAWWTPEAIRRRLLDEIELADMLARWRIRMAGHDIREAIDDWPRVMDIVLARKGGYQPLDRTPNPWPPESLDKATWREGVA